MFNIFQTASWYVTFGAVFVLIIIAHVVTRVWERRRFSSDGHRAIERLRKLEHKEPRGGTEPRLTLQHAIEVQKVDFSLTAEPAPTAPPPPGPTGDHTVRNLESLPNQQSTMNQRLPLQVGTKVQAVRKFGSIKKGVPGIITGRAVVRFLLWSRSTYVCTFADNMTAHARPSQIAAYEHGYCLRELEQPDFALNLSRQMTRRAQQLFSGQHPARVSNTLSGA